MAGSALTAAFLVKLLTPVATDLYASAKGQVKQELSKWNTKRGIQNMATTLSQIDKVKTIWSPELEKSLSEIYYPSALIIQGKRTVIDDISELPQGNLVIEGIVGQGKSMFMRHIAASMVAAPNITRIPAFIELRNISKRRSLSSLISSFINSLSAKHTAETFEYLASSGKMALILDGFDEIPSNCISETIVELQTLQISHPDLKIIISSRPQSHIQNAAGLKVVKLAELSDSDYDPFLMKLITVTSKRNEVLGALSDCATSIQGIIVTPLMLTLVVIVYQTEKEIPSTLSGFFDRLFGVVFAKHDRLKAGFNRQHHSGLSEEQLKKLFEIFCFMAIQHGLGRSMREQVFNKTFEQSVNFAPELQCPIEGFKKDIINVACLIIEEGMDIRTFLHKSILDYHAAAFVCSLTEAQAKRFYTAAYVNYDRWEHVLNFLESIDKLRYGEHYIIDNIPNALESLRSLIASQDQQLLINYIETIAPNAEAEFTGSLMTKYTRTVRNNGELDKIVSDALPRAVFAMCGDASRDEVARVALRTGQDSDNKNVIPLRVLIGELGYDHILKALKRVEFDQEARLLKFQDFVKAEKLKDSLFIDMLADPNLPRKERKGRKIS
jgi:hypothetical protein